MSNYFTSKQVKAIKALLFNQDLDNENIQLLRKAFKNADTSDMTIDEAQSIIDKMPQAKKDVANNILLGKVKPLIPERYYMERNAGRVAEQMMKEFLFLFIVFIIVVALLGGQTYIGAGIFLCWLVYLVGYTNCIIPKWVKVQILHFIKKKSFKDPNREK